jgi:phenylalanyl-tRNA synthetase beta chain
VLGIKLNVETVSGIFNRFGYQYTISGEEFIVNPPHERDDIEIKQDLIEEVGRMHGLSNIVSIAPVAQPVAEINTRHYYAEKIRTSLSALGFSEVYTSSFRNKDIAHIKNALASDKSYLRSKLMDNLIEVRTRNIPYRDLLGITAVQVFEIGTIFNVDTEAFHVGLAVQTGTEYKAKQDESLLALALNVLEASLETKLTLVHSAPGYIEFSLEALLPKLVKPTVYDLLEKSPAVLYKPFSLYPSVSRDVAMWVSEGVKVSVVEAALRAASGDQLVRLTHLDTFAKDGRTSLAFRLVFQSYEKTLDGSEVDTQMNAVYDIVSGAGWEVR